jgi:hypothetical protein
MSLQTITLIFTIILQVTILSLVIYQTIQINKQTVLIKHPIKTLSHTIKEDLSDPYTIRNFMELVPSGMNFS